MTDRTSSDECRQAAVALIAGRAVGAVSGPLAGPFRHFLRLHGLSGLAAVAMDKGRLELPADTAQRVRSDWDAARRWSQALDDECVQIGRGLATDKDELSIPILLKGASVSSRYQDPSLRTYVDIDLLVPPEEVRPWAKRLRCYGYWAPSPEVRGRGQAAVAITSA